MPTFQAGYNGYVAFGTAASETDISSIIESADFERMVNMLETTSFGSSSKTRIPGLKDSTFKVSANWDATLVATLNGLLGATSKNLIVGPMGSTASNIKYSVNAVLSKISEKVAVGGKVQVELEFSTTGVVTVGTF